MIDVTRPGLQFYIDQLHADRRFSLARYGNGEWDCILGRYPHTRSGSQAFTPDLRAALTDTLTHAPGGECYHALQSRTYLERVGLLAPAAAWCAANAPGITWHDGEVLVKASLHGELYPLIQALSFHDLVVVGPPWLLKLPFARVFIPTPARNAWEQADALTRKLRGFPNCVISLSCGPLAKVLIHRLYRELPSSWLLDFGSLWDPYCGKRSRRYHARLTPEILRRNLEGA